MIGVEVGNENVRDVRRFKVESCKLIDDQVFFFEVDGSHPTIETHGKFLCLIKKAIGIAGVKKHRAEFWVPKQCEHGGEVNRAPTSALDGEVFG